MTINFCEATFDKYKSTTNQSKNNFIQIRA